MNDQSRSWYIRGADNKPAGPLTAEALLTLVRKGEVNTRTICWREGMPQWRPLNQAKPFASALGSTSVPGRIVAGDAAKSTAPQAAASSTSRLLSRFRSLGRPVKIAILGGGIFTICAIVAGVVVLLAMGWFGETERTLQSDAAHPPGANAQPHPLISTTDLESTGRRADQLVQKMRTDIAQAQLNNQGNALALREARERAVADGKRTIHQNFNELCGKTVDWYCTVERVTTSCVFLRPVGRSLCLLLWPPGESVVPLLGGLVDDRVWALKLGKHVSEADATKLRPGDRLRVQGTVLSLDIVPDNPEHQQIILWFLPGEPVQVTPWDLCAEYAANDSAAENKFGGHMLEVTATVTWTGRTSDGRFSLSLTDSRSDLPALRKSNDFACRLFCHFDEEQESEAAKLSKGQNITLRGICRSGQRLPRGGGGGIVLEKCRLLDYWRSAPVRGHTESVTCVAWSPDGKRLASASRDETVKVWDAANGQEALSFHGHTNEVACVAWSPDGKRLASASSRDQILKVWDAASGQEALSFHGHTNGVACVVWSPDGKCLASAPSIGDRPTIWDSTTGRQLLTLPNEGWLAFECVAWSPAGKFLAWGYQNAGRMTQNAKFRVYDLATGTQTFTLLKTDGAHGHIQSVDWSRDGKYLATATIFGRITVWSAGTGEEARVMGNRAVRGDRFASQERPGLVHHIAFSPDGKFLASAGVKTVSVWDTATGVVALTLHGHTESVTWVAWSPDGKRLASSSDDKTVRVWDAVTGEELLTLPVDARAELKENSDTQARGTRDPADEQPAPNRVHETLNVPRITLQTRPGQVARGDFVRKEPGAIEDASLATPTYREERRKEREELARKTRGPLSGDWKDTDGLSFRIDDDGNTLTLRVTTYNSHVHSLTAELRRREGSSDAFEGTLQAQFYGKTSDYSETVSAKLNKPDELELRLPNWPNPGIGRKSRLRRVTLTRQ